MALHIIGRCGNCQSITSRTVEGSHQCRACHAKGIKPVQAQRAEKRAANANELPRHIEDALADASYLLRSSSSDGPRVAAIIPGLGSVMLGGEGGEDIVERINRVWPTLNDAQVSRVVRYIDAGAAARIRAATQRPGREKDRWIDRY
ncbi:hypothetical protein [Paraburkholderia caledonica]|uniref:hypothetical protein n=1 Tax=Paraburkholderia caledonica TaxID=134536 RepID=UPI000DEF8305|nr:hypothetical protein [Paraburkholderia caledonica]AXF14802.1 hypothetical protein CUJ87_10575 [Paraburkholderia caledonica]